MKEQYIKINENGKSYYSDKEMTILHREDGPAYEGKNGKMWFKNGKRHREDGPAIEWADGEIEYWIDGNLIYENDFHLKLNIKRLEKLWDEMVNFYNTEGELNFSLIKELKDTINSLSENAKNI